jgi:6-phosphogluconolactonase/glucosamine-6-phosphate isomerase/deaminase
MKFYKINSPETVINYIAKAIADHLGKGEKVLWLLSGGSAIKLECEIASRLAGGDVSKLNVTLIDERFGLVGHSDSNWKQLELSAFSLPGAKLYPVLTGKDMEQTARDYAKTFQVLADEADYVLGQAGLGPDGHILGIKPGSPALGSDKLVEAYDWDDYRRITLTARAMEMMDEIVVYAAGAEKREQLLKLQIDIPADEQPAQLLKQHPKAIIFSDQVGDVE